MQNLVTCGRLISRAFANGLYSFSQVQTSHSSASSNSSLSQEKCEALRNAHKKLTFLTAISGSSKALIKEKSQKPGKFGDDSYFVARHKLGDVLGIADGVGGWRSWGIDPGEFSSTLMRSCERIVLGGLFTPSDPAAVLSSAYHELCQNKSNIVGSSTACLVILHTQLGRMFSANIGDSGFLVVRKGCIVHRSQEQQHYFNTPFQLTVAPPGISDQVLSDAPESAAKQEFDMQIGDLLVLATDGVFDNLPDSVILKELIKVVDTTDLLVLQKAANSIANVARTLAFDHSYMSPFARSARQNGIQATGGKPDDITVILASVMG